MYFDNVELFPLEQYVRNLDRLYAHTKEGHKETLKEHLDLAYKYFIDVCKAKNLDIVFENLEKAYKFTTDEEVKLWKELICNTIYLHDIGKINSRFQYDKMDNKNYRGIEAVNSKHSMLSACIYFDYYISKLQKLQGRGDMPLLITFLFMNCFIISKHHGSLSEFYEFGENFSAEYCNYKEMRESFKDYKDDLSFSEGAVKKFFAATKDVLDKSESKEPWQSVDFYIYVRFMFSILVAADFYATSQYQNNSEIKDFGLIDNINGYYSIFKKSPVYKSIEQYKGYLNGEKENPYRSGDINELRTQMFLEAEEMYIQQSKDYIFYLEAPTGAGKTNTSVNLALKTIEMHSEINKIFYIFPFNTLVEQTKKSLDDIFKSSPEVIRNISVINSITPIRTEDKDEDNKNVRDSFSKEKIDYEKSLLNRQFIHYPIVLTTHINIFNYFFGISREEAFPLIQLANSVVILDEIQSYKNSIWKEIITFLDKYAKLLNIKIIIMSATLPDLNKLIDGENRAARLIKDRDKYFNNPIFKDRVSLDFSLLDLTDDIEEELFNKVLEETANKDINILVEFIKKARAAEFYKRLSANKDSLGKEILLITGDDNKAERKTIIDKVKNYKNIILIATQVIEAGVDIDMDIGFKDISLLDAEEQFLGRINRSCKKKGCKVYFFNLDEAKQIYKGDIRKQSDVTLTSKEIREILQSKNFNGYYVIVLKRLENNLGKENDGSIHYFRKETVGKLKFEDVKKRLELIEEAKEYTLFINREVTLEDGKILKGEDVWQEYTDLLKDTKMSYAERRVKLSIVNEKVDYFTYKVNRYLSSYDDCIGDMFYINDGDKYFTEGKFDRSKINKTEKFEFIGC